MTYRVYFNRCQDWPQVWSVDEGEQSTEINVVGISIDGRRVTSHMLQGLVPEGAPRAWFEVEASAVRIVNGCAVFEG